MKVLENVNVFILQERYKRFIAKLISSSWNGFSNSENSPVDSNDNTSYCRFNRSTSYRPTAYCTNVSTAYCPDSNIAYCPNPGLMSDLPIIGSRCLVAKTEKNLRLVALEAEPTSFFVSNISLRDLLNEFLQSEITTREKLEYFGKRFQEFVSLYEKHDESFLDHIEVKKRSPLWRNVEKMRKAVLNRFVIENSENRWIGIDTQISNELAKTHLVSLFPNEEFLAEKKVENCRFDFVSSQRIVEVKFCHWKQEDFVLFPDCITERGSKQLRTLLKQSLEKNLIFIAQRDDVKYLDAGLRDREYYDLFHSSEIRKNAFAYNLEFENNTLLYRFTKELEIKRRDYVTIIS